MLKIVNEKPANVIDYQPEWTDEFGFMSNAMDYCIKNVKRGERFFGVRYTEFGGIQTFEMSCMGGEHRILLTTDGKTQVVCKVDAMTLDSNGSKHRELYKPYRDPQNAEKTIWKCEMKTHVVQYSNLSECPARFNHYLVALAELVHSPWPESDYKKTHVDFISLATSGQPPSDFKHIETTQNDVLFYNLTHTRMAGVKFPAMYRKGERNIDWRYRAISMLLRTATDVLTQIMKNQMGSLFSDVLFSNVINIAFDREWRRLAKLDHMLDAIDIYRYMYKVPYDNAKESVEQLMSLN